MSAQLIVRVQESDFDTSALQAGLLAGNAGEGAVATFTGYVRNANAGNAVASMTLEHYPGMTEKSIAEILDLAAQRWPILAASVVHRVGTLQPGEQIVWVGVASAHRAAAFSACEFLMDYLKTRAPFWKKEQGAGKAHWVDAKASDNTRADRWR
ncbi:MAG: molybdopterin synthase catalytic subunit [Bacteroidia bacterium]